MKEFHFSKTVRYLSKRNTMTQILPVNKTEWEAFLETLSEFEKKHSLLLNKIDTLQSKLQDEQSRVKNARIDTAETSRNEIPPQPRISVVRNNFPGVLDGKVRALNKPDPTVPKRPYVVQNNAYCSSCGYRIISATRACDRCGCNFNALVCSCGRELTGSEKFCDHCGRNL